MPETPRHQHSPAELKAQLEAERSGSPFLVYRDAAGEQRIFVLTGRKTELTIGRSEATDICLASDADVSRVHAELEQIGGSWAIVDDGLSSNGTLVNDERTRGRRRLHGGDQIAVGKTAIRFRTGPAGSGVATGIMDTLQPPAELSDRQRRVLVALARPRARRGPYAPPATNKEIAEELVMSVDAVKTHMRALFQKFAVGALPQNQKRARLVELALESGAVGERDLENPSAR
jgi:hypothetical protein